MNVTDEMSFLGYHDHVCRGSFLLGSQEYAAAETGPVSPDVYSFGSSPSPSFRRLGAFVISPQLACAGSVRRFHRLEKERSLRSFSGLHSQMVPILGILRRGVLHKSFFGKRCSWARSSDACSEYVVAWPRLYTLIVLSLS